MPYFVTMANFRVNNHSMEDAGPCTIVDTFFYNFYDFNPSYVCYAAF